MTRDARVSFQKRIRTFIIIIYETAKTRNFLTWAAAVVFSITELLFSVATKHFVTDKSDKKRNKYLYIITQNKRQKSKSGTGSRRRERSKLT